MNQLNGAVALCLAAVCLGLPMATNAQVQPIYSLGVSLDGVPGPLTRVEDGSFYGVFNAGGRAGFGFLFHLSAEGTKRETVFDFANATTNDTVTAGTIVGITNGFIFGVFTDFPPSGSTNLLYRVATNGTGFTLLRGLPPVYSSLLLASDQRFYLVHSSQLDRFELDGTAQATIANELDLIRLFEGSDGLFYGSSSTVLRRLKKDGSQITTLTNTSRGILSLMLGSEGRIYGTTDNFPNGQLPFVVNTDGTGL